MIGNRIKRARQVKGISQKELAKLLGVSIKTLVKYERNEAMPNSRVLRALAKALNVSIEYLLRRETVRITKILLHGKEI